jgi:hypothetical protein
MKKTSQPFFLKSKSVNNNKYNNSRSSQCQRLLKEFEANFRISTFDGRDQLGIPHMAGRVLDLRKSGYRIDTHWINSPDSNGIKHRIAQYVYHGRKENPNA